MLCFILASFYVVSPRPWNDNFKSLIAFFFFFWCTNFFSSLTVTGLLICISFIFSCHKSWHIRQEATFSSISLLDAYQNAIAHVLLLTNFIGSNSHDVFSLILFGKGYWKKLCNHLSAIPHSPFWEIPWYSHMPISLFRFPLLFQPTYL